MQSFRLAKDLNAFELEKKTAAIVAKRTSIALARQNGSSMGRLVQEIEEFNKENSGEVKLRLPLAAIAFITRITGIFTVWGVCNLEEL